jgi:predicted TIM-barrel fold metal-dependent hydrolase
MGRKYQVISADGHVETPPDVFVRHVPERHRDRAPRLIHLPEGGEGWLIEGQPMLRNGQNIAGRDKVKFSGGTYFNPDGSPAEGAGPAEQRLREQDLDGIDAEVLFPPVFASRFLEGIKDPEVYRSMIRAYNTFLAHDFCSVAPDRLIGNSVTPVSGIEHAVEELEWVAANGLRTVAFYQFPNGTGFAQPEDDRFWEKSLELGLKLSPHFGFGEVRAPVTKPGEGTAGQPWASALTQRAGSHAPVYCIAQLLAAGVFERFPELEFYFAETNASWLPSTLYFLDDNYDLFHDWFGVHLDRRPSEIVLQHCHFGIIRDPVALQMGPSLIPFDNIMWGTDFPHSVGSFPDSRQWLDDAFSVVDEKLKRQVLLENPARYFGLDLDADITETPAA